MGFLLILMGIGNWITGEVNTSHHQSAALGLAIGELRRAPSLEEIEIARSRMDFYHVVGTGGRVLTALGLLLATLGVARHVRS